MSQRILWCSEAAAALARVHQDLLNGELLSNPSAAAIERALKAFEQIKVGASSRRLRSFRELAGSPPFMGLLRPGFDLAGVTAEKCEETCSFLRSLLEPPRSRPRPSPEDLARLGSFLSAVEDVLTDDVGERLRE